MSTDQPKYIDAAEKGILQKRATAATAILSACSLCPRNCRVDRLSDETGFCQTGRQAWVSSHTPHFGEEKPLVGTGGSGTIFFTHCNLGCNFCQNYDISHEGDGQPVPGYTLAHLMLELQSVGCHNINFVTPTHVVPQILSALEIAVENGLTVPLVYNSGGYDCVETLRLLEGIVDIYMPDFKFWDSKVSEITCSASDYPETARSALTEMHRQVGDLIVDARGIAKRGLLVRHLVMPGGLAGTREVMRFIGRSISSNTYVNIMPQYRPCGRAEEIREIAGPLTPSDFNSALEAAREEGITRLDKRRRTFLVR